MECRDIKKKEPDYTGMYLDLEKIEKQEVMIFPSSLWRYMIKSDLTDTSIKIYQYLYHESKKSRSKNKKVMPVIVSRSKLCDILDLKKTAINNGLVLLREHGWIKSEARYQQNTGFQQACLFWVIVPCAAKEKILSAPNRVSKKSHNIFDNRVKNVQEAPVVKSPDREGTNSELFARYVKQVNHFKGKGYTLSKPHQKALSMFSEEEKYLLNKILLKNEKKEDVSCQVVRQRDTRVVDKASTYQYNKIQYVNIVNKGESGFDGSGCESSESPRAFSVEEKEKIQEEVARMILDLSSKNLVPTSLMLNGRTNDDLITEVCFHAMNYNPQKVSSSTHAIRAALKIIKRGIWDTPKKIKCERWRESIILEKKAKEFKREYLVC